MYVENNSYEAFKLVNMQSATSYLLKKIDTGLSKPYFVDFSKKYNINPNTIISKVTTLNEKLAQKVSNVRNLYEGIAMIKDAKHEVELSNKNKLHKINKKKRYEELER